MDQEAPYSKEDVEFFVNDGQILDEADLAGSKLRKIELVKTSLKGADLEGADLSDADLRGTNFENANLRKANLMGANLTRACLRKTDLTGARLDMAILIRADLTEACFSGANLYHSVLKGANIENADFTGASLQLAYLYGAKSAETANFERADLSGARVNFTGLDTRELGAGAKGGSRYPSYGWRTKAFDFMKISWTEFVSDWFKTLFLAPFRFIGWIFRRLWQILTFPFRVFLERKEKEE